MKGRNKLVPRLLGITKESILRLDENTKEILKTWPLTTVRRWVAAPRVFTLDFGDYQDQYYSVQTNEGEQISALIAGYIDIILKRRLKETEPEGGIDGEIMETDINSAQHARNIQLNQGLGGQNATNVNLAKPGECALSALSMALYISYKILLCKSFCLCY